jgi:hypothetical protein
MISKNSSKKKKGVVTQAGKRSIYTYIYIREYVYIINKAFKPERKNHRQLLQLELIFPPNTKDIKRDTSISFGHERNGKKSNIT